MAPMQTKYRRNKKPRVGCQFVIPSGYNLPTSCAGRPKALPGRVLGCPLPQRPQLRAFWELTGAVRLNCGNGGRDMHPSIERLIINASSAAYCRHCSACRALQGNHKMHV
eukprot:1140973-Pelagomonas_calceolata.AAC.5